MKYSCGNNMPIQAPLIPDPFVPYHCEGNIMAYVICRGDEAKIRELLAPSRFEYIDDRYMVEISDFSNCDKVPFMDAAIVLPVRYKDIDGGCYLFEFENNDSAIAAGRDLWGYPKKHARIELDAREDGISTGNVIRNGEVICRMELDPSMPVDTPQLKLAPHLNAHVLPRSDGPGILMTRIIARDTSPDFELQKHVKCKANLELKNLPSDPWAALGIKDILGGGIIWGNFHATDENGWGKVLDVYQ